MNEAVFIADLHLNPEDHAITEKFHNFCAWALRNTKSIYILGDFFHAWAGDDVMDSWSINIARKLANLVDLGVKIYFLPGNRDFLICKKFAKIAKIIILPEPHLISLNHQKILLVHGDRYCTNDKAHQCLRVLTRNQLFCKLFLLLPQKLRKKIVNKARIISQNNHKSDDKYSIVAKKMLKNMYNLNSRILIHGHIHKPGIKNHSYKNDNYSQFTVSDWDDAPTIVCYNGAKGFYLNQI